MPRKTHPPKESIPPTLPPHRAIELLKIQLLQGMSIEQRPRADPEVKKWETTTVSIVEAAFGRDGGEMHHNTAEFINCYKGASVLFDDAQLEERHRMRVRTRRALLESFIEQLEILAPAASPSK